MRILRAPLLTSKKFKIFALRVLSIQYANTARIEALRLQMPARNRKRMQSLLQIQRNTGTHHASPPPPRLSPARKYYDKKRATRRKSFFEKK